MYDLVMGNQEREMIADALKNAMGLRKMSAAELARASGVDKSTISLILKGDRPNTPAVIVAKLARGLNVSADFLVGITEEAEPKSLQLGEILLELTEVGKKLTSRRQRDLLAMARTYLDHSASLKVDPDLLARELLDLVKEGGGDTSYQKLLELLQDDKWIDNSSAGNSPSKDIDEPPDDES